MSLDARQLAMLEAMGLVAWAPRDATNEADAPPEESIAVAEPADAHADSAPAPAVHRAETQPRAAPQAATPRATAPASPRVTTAASAAATEPARAAAIAAMDWPELREAVTGCEACQLCKGRRQAVFGVGHQQADWMIVGEAPGEQEDLRGEPFVGPSGQLLDNMLQAVGLTRAEAPPERQVFIANVIKCRPPQNRNPEPGEVAQCEPYLKRQVELVRPRIILAMGRFAVQSLLQTNDAIGKLRGRVHHYQGVPVIVTYHPSYLLRNLPEKARAWEDLCLAMDTLGLG